MVATLEIIERKLSEITFRLYAILSLVLFSLIAYIFRTVPTTITQSLFTALPPQSIPYISTTITTLGASLLAILLLYQILKVISCIGDIAKENLDTDWQVSAEDFFSYTVLFSIVQVGFALLQLIFASGTIFFITELLDTLTEGLFIYFFFRFAVATIHQTEGGSHLTQLTLFKYMGIAIYGISFVFAIIVFFAPNPAYTSVMNFILYLQIPIFISVLYTLHILLKLIRSQLPTPPAPFLDSILSDTHDHDHDYDHDHDHHHEHHHDHPHDHNHNHDHHHGHHNDHPHDH